MTNSNPTEKIRSIKSLVKILFDRCLTIAITEKTATVEIINMELTITLSDREGVYFISLEHSNKELYETMIDLNGNHEYMNSVIEAVIAEITKHVVSMCIS